MTGFDVFGVPFRGVRVLATVPGTVIRPHADNCVVGVIVRLDPDPVTGAPAVERFVPAARCALLNENGAGAQP